MGLLENIENYIPVNEQEENDKKVMLDYMKHNPDYLTRENKVAHFTTSIWTVNRERTKTLMVYHNIYDSWSSAHHRVTFLSPLCEPPAPYRACNSP